MEYEEEWWSPQTPYYQKERTVEIIELFQKELITARTVFGASQLGYKYSDGTTLKIFWETPEYLGDDVEDHQRDVVYCLHGGDFYVDCRMSAPQKDEGAMLLEYSWAEIIEDYLWIDGIYGDEQAKAWLRNPPERFIIDAETYLSSRPNKS